MKGYIPVIFGILLSVLLLSLLFNYYHKPEDLNFYYYNYDNSSDFSDYFVIRVSSNYSFNDISVFDLFGPAVISDIFPDLITRVQNSSDVYEVSFFNGDYVDLNISGDNYSILYLPSDSFFMSIIAYPYLDRSSNNVYTEFDLLVSYTSIFRELNSKKFEKMLVNNFKDYIYNDLTYLGDINVN